MAFRLWELAAGEIVAPHGLEELIDRIQAEQGITYAPQQRQAVELAATSQVMLLTGGPGTGKTTSLRGVLALFDALGLETALAAPTGRAAKRLGELCGAEGTTIHRLLETQYDPHSGRLVFAHDESDPLKADAVIVDEMSMVDVELLHHLLQAIPKGKRLILVGDPDQLPSVGPGNLFSDLIRSGVIPMVRLTEIFRQAAESAIVRSAHGVNRGELPDLRDNKHDFFFLRRKEPARAAETIVELVKTRLPNNMGIPPEQIQVLSPTRKRTAGTASLKAILKRGKAAVASCLPVLNGVRATTGASLSSPASIFTARTSPASAFPPPMTLAIAGSWAANWSGFRSKRRCARYATASAPTAAKAGCAGLQTNAGSTASARPPAGLPIATAARSTPSPVKNASGKPHG